MSDGPHLDFNEHVHDWRDAQMREHVEAFEWALAEKRAAARVEYLGTVRSRIRVKAGGKDMIQGAQPTKSAPIQLRNAKSVFKVPTTDEIQVRAEDARLLEEAQRDSRQSGNGPFNKLRFLTSAHQACQRLKQDLMQQSAGEVARELSDVVRLLDRALDSPTARSRLLAQKKLSTLSTASRDWVAGVARERRRVVPETRGWESDEARQKAFAEWRTLLTRGGKLVPGRNRASGKKSRPTFKWSIIAPEVSMGRPRQEAARTFVWNLRLACVEAGYTPQLRTHHRSTSKFADFVEYLSQDVGAEFNVDEMVNAWAHLHEIANL